MFWFLTTVQIEGRAPRAYRRSVDRWLEQAHEFGRNLVTIEVRTHRTMVCNWLRRMIPEPLVPGLNDATIKRWLQKRREWERSDFAKLLGASERAGDRSRC